MSYTMSLPSGLPVLMLLELNPNSIGKGVLRGLGAHSLHSYPPQLW